MNQGEEARSARNVPEPEMQRAGSSAAAGPGHPLLLKAPAPDRGGLKQLRQSQAQTPEVGGGASTGQCCSRHLEQAPRSQLD